MMAAKQPQPSDYTVAWLCALPEEFSAAIEMLGKERYRPPEEKSDPNNYVCGKISNHNVVVCCLPDWQHGATSAASMIHKLTSRYRSVRFALLVGIGGGVPSDDNDIRLGDVVISGPPGGVIECILVKSSKDGMYTRFMNGPPEDLQNAATTLKQKLTASPTSMPSVVVPTQTQLLQATRASDQLFESSYNHVHVEDEDCRRCDPSQQKPRKQRSDDKPRIHIGTIASTNQVIKNGAIRDKISSSVKGVLCVEMEAAGIMDALP